MSTGPSWKHSGGQASNRPTTSRKTWQPGQTPAAKKPANPAGRHRLRIVTAGVSLSALIGLIILLIWLLSPTKTPSLVVVAPSAAESTGAPNNAASGAADLAAEFQDRKSRPAHRRGPGPEGRQGRLVPAHRPEDEAPGRPPLRLHGAADKDGPFLWFVPADADAADPGHKLPVTDVLTYIEQSLENHPPVVLILDAATETAAWARGQLHNDFARQLKKLDARIKAVPNLVVICSADDDQRSWVAEERRQTAFAHYLREGLRGVGFPPNERVTAAALFEYLQKNASDWAQANRDAPQKPFLLPTGDPERANRLVIVTLGADAAKPASPPSGGGYPDALKGFWQKQADRADRSPPPEATAPHVWRQYLDLLLKADRAARATQGDLPQEVHNRLTDLETELDVRPWANPPDCVPYALPAATALWEPRKEVTADQIQSVLSAPNKLTAWTDLAGRTNPGDRQRPEVRLAGADAVLKYLLLNQTRLDHATLDKAADLLQLIDGGAAGRPVETHLVQMFKLHLKDRDPDLVRQAIRVQIAAEQAAWFGGDPKLYPHAEQVARWFGPALLKADERRRELTDLVFAGTTDDVPGTGTPEVPKLTLADALDANRKEYEALAAQANALGNAYRLRDKVLSRLPYYARWAAARRLPAGAAEPVLKQIEDLADMAHKLTDLLEAPTPGDTDAVLKLADTLQTGDATRPGFDRLAADFKAHCAALSEKAVPSNWHAIDAALEVPFIPPADRATLLEKSRSISRGLESAGSFTGADVTKVVPQEMAQRQGRMAVAVLGRRGFGARTGGLPKDDVAALIAQPDRSAWWESLTAAGAEIGAAFTALPEQAAKRVKEGSLRTPETAADEVRQAAALTRLIDGATRLPARTINPVAEERRYRTHLLLIGQARRAAADGWADYKAGAGYSAGAAQKYLESAETILFSGSPVRESERERWKSNFPKSLPEPRFTFETRAGFSVTNQPDERLPYTVTPTGAAAGYPVLKVHDIVSPVTAEKLTAGTYDAYVPVGRFAGPQANPQAGVVTLGVGEAKDGDEGGVKLDLLYRGWVTSKKVVANYAGTPFYEWVWTPPKGQATLAVRGDDVLRDGAVAFIIDASGSMAKDSKYAKTISALRDILKKLPPGTMVSVHFFAGVEGPKGELTEVLPPTNWTTPGDQTERLYNDKLTKRTLDGDVSPISDAIRRALQGEKVFAKTASGHRSLIVLTDGAEYTDTEDPRNPTDGPGRSVIATLREVQKTQDVALHLMLIGASEKGYQNARKQFEVMEDPARNDSPGTLPVIWPREDPNARGKPLDDLKESGDLVAVIRESMLPRIIVRTPGGKEVGTVPVSIPATDGHWAWLRRPLDPGTYHLSLAQSRQAHQVLQLDPGERMILNLRKVGNKLDFTLPSYADVRDGLGGLDRTSPKHNRLEMTVPRNFLTSHGSDFDLQMTATLENPLVKEEQLRNGLRRVRPMFVWFDIAPRGGAGQPKRVRVENLANRFAPAWRLTAGPWVPGPGGPGLRGNAATTAATVTGYWLDSTPADSDRLVLPTVDTKPKGDQLIRRVGGKEILIKELSVRDGVLRITLNHEKDQPVVVRVALNQPWTLTERHLFFDNAQYTATFEGFSPEDLKKELTLDFYLISGVRARAESDKTKLIVDVNNPPQANDPRDLLPEQNDAPK